MTKTLKIKLTQQQLNFIGLVFEASEFHTKMTLTEYLQMLLIEHSEQIAGLTFEEFAERATENDTPSTVFWTE